jgi:hypothetical protein
MVEDTLNRFQNRSSDRVRTPDARHTRRRRPARSRQRPQRRGPGGVAGRLGTERPRLQRYVQMYKDEGVLKEMPPIKDLSTDQFVECTNKVDAASVRKLAREWKS